MVVLAFCAFTFIALFKIYSALRWRSYFLQQHGERLFFSWSQFRQALDGTQSASKKAKDDEKRMIEQNAVENILLVVGAAVLLVVASFAASYFD